MKRMYVLLGGDAKDLKDNSLYSKYLPRTDDAPFIIAPSKQPKGAPKGDVARSSEERRRPESSSLLKSAIRKFKGRLNTLSVLRGLRNNMENVRVLCDLIQKREKLKLRLEIGNTELFDRNLTKITKNWLRHGTRRGARTSAS
eukprot:TRINITY_DN1941_c0_g1_i4.p2 TRINITY_DN1941_c0_g1~~TRINITY_DN1941_c0_g1_i4.p2  ORF type:complete len:143 (+),score=26.94 TRINITY_DN1941_c0_g1_i4:509-937(+)